MLDARNMLEIPDAERMQAIDMSIYDVCICISYINK